MVDARAGAVVAEMVGFACFPATIIDAGMGKSGTGGGGSMATC